MSDSIHNQPSYPPPVVRDASGAYVVASLARKAPAEKSRDLENAVSPAFLLWVLQQWWKIVIPAGLLFAAIAAATVIYTFVHKYEANALLIIEDVSPFIAFSGGGGQRASERYIQTQLELLRSPVVLVPMLGRPEIAPLPELTHQPDRVGYLREKLSVKRLGNSELYRISYISASPSAAASIVNAAIAEYMNIQAGDEFQRSQRVIDLLEEERRRRAIEVERLRKRVVDLAKEVTGKDPFSGTMLVDKDGVATPAASIFNELTEIDVEREILQAQIQAHQDSIALIKDPLESSELLDLEIENHSDVTSRQAALASIQAQMDGIKEQASRYMNKPSWENDPLFIGLQRDHERITKDLEAIKSKHREMVLMRRKEQRKFDRDQEVEKMALRVRALETRKKLLSDRFQEQVDGMISGQAKGVELEFARAELAREEKVFEMIASRRIALQTELRAPARVQLRQKANVPTMPVETIPYKILFVACAAAFAAPFGLAAAKEATVRRVADVDQLSQEARVRVLGEIAALPVRHVAISPNKMAGRLRRDAYIFAESINSLRTNMAVAESLKSQQVVAVTSAVSGEGKSSIATSLTMSIANASDSPTLIIDADMRSPDVATMLKTRSQPGLFELLSNKCSLEAAIHRVGESNVYVIPAGRATRNPHHIVGMTEVNQLLDQLRERFPAIVIDTPPILGASEALILAKAADSTLFCSLCDVSRVKQVRMAVDRLEHAGVNIAGAVLSGTPTHRYAYTYGYYATQTETAS